MTNGALELFVSAAMALILTSNCERSGTAQPAGYPVVAFQNWLLHKSLHTIPSNVIQAWASGATAAPYLRALGAEALSVRLPVDTPAGHAVSAREAVIKAYRVLAQNAAAIDQDPGHV